MAEASARGVSFCCVRELLRYSRASAVHASFCGTRELLRYSRAPLFRFSSERAGRLSELRAASEKRNGRGACRHDALASTANYLKRAGWQSGQTWGYEVRLPAGFDYGLARRGTTRTLKDWRRLGLRRTTGASFPRPGDEARLLLPAGARGPAFLVLKNFRVIKRYNNADAYALAVGHLADRLRGGDLLDVTKDLSPLPLMGVPGWWGGGQDEAFYADKDVFRPPRS